MARRNGAANGGVGSQGCLCYGFAMKNAAFQSPPPMTIDEFLVWREEREFDGRFELHGGRVVEANAETLAHAVVKFRMAKALDRAILRAQLPCQVLPDGMAVTAGINTVFEPDAQVYCGERLADDSLLVPNPVIVVEVLSPSTRRRDIGIKLTRYFLNETIQHYLIVVIEDRKIIHHRRLSGGDIATRIVASGEILLDPPGLVLPVNEVFAED